MKSFDLPSRRYAYDEIAAWPDEARRELNDGTPVLLYALGFCPAIAHSRCIGALFMALADGNNRGGKTILSVDWQIDEWNSVAPDLCFYNSAPKVRPDNQCLTTAPDLTIEVWDERTHENDATRKPTLYAWQNVPIFWLVNPEKQTVLVHRAPTPNGYRSILELKQGDVLNYHRLPNFGLPLFLLFNF